MTTGETLFLERPAFWTENSDPEAWFRALQVLRDAPNNHAMTGTPRTVSERCLVGTIAWRGAAGLFGAYRRQGRMLLPGVGLMAQDDDGNWALSTDAADLLSRWERNPHDGLTTLATFLINESVWLRLLLLRLLAGDWTLENWAGARSSRAGLRAGRSLLLHGHAEVASWLQGQEQVIAARWLARSHCRRLAIDPGVFQRRSGKDDLSLAPLTAPLHLLESVGWLTRSGELALPPELTAELSGQTSPAQTLSALTVEHADVRGFVAAEITLRQLLSGYGVTPTEERFARWMDTLVDDAIQTGALELLSTEPGQARHGRGLHADPSRQLVRWVVHPEFNAAFERAWPSLAIERVPTR